MTPEQRAEHITREEREKPKGDGYWFDTDHLRVVEITDLTSRIAAAIREAEAAVHAKYAEILKAADEIYQIAEFKTDYELAVMVKYENIRKGLNNGTI